MIGSEKDAKKSCRTKPEPAKRRGGSNVSGRCKAGARVLSKVGDGVRATCLASGLYALAFELLDAADVLALSPNCLAHLKLLSKRELLRFVELLGGWVGGRWREALSAAPPHASQAAVSPGEGEGLYLTHLPNR